MTRRLVAVDLPPGTAFVEELRRCWDDGDAVLPIDPRLAGPAKAAMLDVLRPGLIVDASGRSTRDDGVPALDGDALVVATSGTTGEPKGVVLTHNAVNASASATNARLGIDPARDRWLATLPVAHVGGLSVITRALASSTPFTVVDHFDPDIVNAARFTGHTRISLVVTALQRVETDGWRTILVGGSAMPEALPDNCVRTYGMTETGSGVVYDGFALEGVGITLGDDGEILIDGPMLLRAYRSTDGASTPEGFDPKDAAGRFATSDAGRFRADGRLEVLGRRGDVIVTGGEKVWPDAVERVLRSAFADLDAAVAGQADDEWGQRVTLFVAAGMTPPSLDEVRSVVRDSLAGYCAPRALVMLDGPLPRTSSGKVNRARLSKRATGPSSTSG